MVSGFARNDASKQANTSPHPELVEEQGLSTILKSPNTEGPGSSPRRSGAMAPHGHKNQINRRQKASRIVGRCVN